MQSSNKTPKPNRRKPAQRAQTQPAVSPRPAHAERREDVSLSRGRHKFDAFPDRIDIRDWTYEPHLRPLPDLIVNCDSVPDILDQGTEGACTGFALAAVINYLLAARNIRRQVSARMLYEMARRYDEWPGESYEGSSARGAMKGWLAHGVCPWEKWPAERHGTQHLSPEVAELATWTPGGAYYRVTHRNIRDMHAALAEVGILYVTLMVHEGWFQPSGKPAEVSYVENGNLHTRSFPLIERKGQASDGHAVAIVGYTREGFIVQNSWGPGWGKDGFALLPYEDYVLHATDVWVAQLGVPIRMKSWEAGMADSTAGLSRATSVVPLNEIRPYIVDVGNNGELSDSGAYWTTERDVQRLFTETIPNATKAWSSKRVMLFLHGGLNSEKAVARRVVAFRDVFLKNQIYPLHIMWESGVAESLNGMIQDLFTGVDERACKWLEDFREGLIEAKDRTFELTTAALGAALWSEMKENAQLASVHPEGIGGVQLIAKHVQAALAGLSAGERQAWELHVVGHSAGSIFAAYALEQLASLGVGFKTLQFLAPALTVQLFKNQVLPHIGHGVPHPILFLLSDSAERDDTVGPYGKSLLYLVSNAFESARGTPILGMEKFVKPEADAELAALFNQQVNGLPSLVLAGQDGGPASRSRSKTHGGFDNDPHTLNAVMRRILNLKDDAALAREFIERDLQY